MDSIENGATIRIGLRKYDKRIDNVCSDFTVPTYSLKINKKSVLNAAGGGGSNEYVEIYKNAAKKIAEIMNEQGVKEYVIYNGERVRFTTKTWESCEYVPNNIEEIFKKTLIDCLNGAE